MNNPCYDIGGGVPPIGIKVKDPMCGISRAIQVVSFQYLNVSIKNARFKPQPSTPMRAFAGKPVHEGPWVYEPDTTCMLE